MSESVEIHEIIKEIKTELKEEFDGRYVQISDCNDRQEIVNKKFANDDKRIELAYSEFKYMKNSLKFNNWLTAGVLAAIIGAVIAYYFVR